MAKRKSKKSKAGIRASKEIRELKAELRREKARRDKLMDLFISPKHKKLTENEIAMRSRLEAVIKAQLEREAEFATFVDAEPLEMLHKNGTVAFQKSILRHDIREPGWTARLQQAKVDDNFDEVAHDIADESDATVQEVYTLFLSP